MRNIWNCPGCVQWWLIYAQHLCVISFTQRKYRWILLCIWWLPSTGIAGVYSISISSRHSPRSFTAYQGFASRDLMHLLTNHSLVQISDRGRNGTGYEQLSLQQYSIPALCSPMCPGGMLCFPRLTDARRSHTSSWRRCARALRVAACREHH